MSRRLLDQEAGRREGEERIRKKSHWSVRTGIVVISIDNTVDDYTADIVLVIVRVDG